MPLEGFLCDLDHEPVACADCVACALAPVPPKGRRCRFTAAMLALMAGNNEARKDAGISATGLCGCLRQTAYNLTRGFYQAPIKLFPAMRGTLFHAMFEGSEGDGVVRERRFFREVDGMRITGQPDEVYLDRKLILDYKTKEKVPAEVPANYAAQLNIYRWIIADGTDLSTGERVNFEVDDLGIMFMTMSEPVKMRVPTWPLHETEAWLRPRLRQIKRGVVGAGLPERIVADPETSKLCTGWCPHYERCITDGV